MKVCLFSLKLVFVRNTHSGGAVRHIMKGNDIFLPEGMEARECQDH